MFDIINPISSIYGSGYKDLPHNTVCGDRLKAYSDEEGYRIHHQEGNMTIYHLDKDPENAYQIVLYCKFNTMQQYEAFNLFRTDNIGTAEAQFTIYKRKVPLLVQMDEKLYTTKRLQKICYTLSSRPSWTVAHVAAFLNLFDVLHKPEILSELNSSDPMTGISPLQVAIRANNFQMVRQLIKAKASLEHLDNKKNSVYHYAAVSTKEIILELGDRSPDNLNSRNSYGDTPLHLARRENKSDCVKALLKIGANVNIDESDSAECGPSFVGDFISNTSGSLSAQEMELDGTPLHWSSDRQMVDGLIKRNCDIDAVNLEGRTALHIMVMKKQLDCVVTLLCGMASVDIADNEGNTPLHLAVKNGGPSSIIQLLICFGADVNMKNNLTETPRHLVDIESDDGKQILYALHAVGAERCESDMGGCTDGCKSDGEFDGDAPKKLQYSPRSDLGEIFKSVSLAAETIQNGRNLKGGRLLCLDGGGIRGLVLVQILLEIQAVSKKSILSCFDWIAGTSTGGILGLALASGKSIQECQALYFSLKEDAFVGSRPYKSKNLENILEHTFGAKEVMTDINSVKLMITGTLADRNPVDLHLFRNYPSPSSLMEVPQSDQFKATHPPDEQLLWKVARATGAAPSYFRAFGRFLDGGLIANNPTLDAMTEIHEYNMALKKIEKEDEVVPLSLVVSLGTGLDPVSHFKDVDLFFPTWIGDVKEAVSGLGSMINILIERATASDGRVVDRARTWCEMIGVPFYRFNPPLNATVDLAEKNDEVLANMMWEVKAYMNANRDKVEELAELLSRDS